MIDSFGIQADFPGVIASAVTGLALGSFATALTWRIPRGESWIVSGKKAAHSACPSCDHRLSWLDLIPLFSWLFLGGRCRYCKAPIGCRYPAIELVTLLTCVLGYLVSGLTGPGLAVMAAMPFLVAMAAIDLEHMILPDQLNLILGLLGLAFAYMLGGPTGLGMAGVAAAAYAGLSFLLAWLMTKLLKKEAMGQGDIKFFAVAGLWLGLPALPAFLMIAGLAGVLLGGMWRIVWKKQVFPFGPALILSFYLCLLFLPQIQRLFY